MINRLSKSLIEKLSENEAHDDAKFFHLPRKSSQLSVKNIPTSIPLKLQFGSIYGRARICDSRLKLTPYLHSMMYDQNRGRRVENLFSFITIFRHKIKEESDGEAESFVKSNLLCRRGARSKFLIFTDVAT